MLLLRAVVYAYIHIHTVRRYAPSVEDIYLAYAVCGDYATCAAVLRAIPTYHTYVWYVGML